MKKIFTCLVVLFSIVTISNGQAPFTTTLLEGRVLRIVEGETGRYETEKDTHKIAEFLAKPELERLNDTVYIKSGDKEVDFFNNSGIALNLFNQGESRASVHTTVLHYRLNIFDPIDKSTAKYKAKLPVMIITKLSSSYDSISSTSAMDILDYEGSPITLRVMPSFALPLERMKNALFVGAYADARLVNMYNGANNSYASDVIGSFGAGLTYQGLSRAGKLDENAEYHPNKFSLSVMFQLATGDKAYMQKLFNIDNATVMGIQSYLSVKLFDNESLHMKIGYQYFFQETISGTKSNFSIALGI